MEKTYTIQNNLSDSTVMYDEDNYSYNELHEILIKRGKAFIKKAKIKVKSIPITVDDLHEKFQSSNLTKEELEDYFFFKTKSNASSWKSKLRSLRKKGRLEQSKIDKMNEHGMLWDPTNNHWEMMYEKYKSEYFVDLLESFIYSKNFLGWHHLCHVINLRTWENEQREFYNNGKFKDENLARLKFINFPFDFQSERDCKIDLFHLVLIINDLRELNWQLNNERKKFMRLFGFKYFIDNEKFEIKASKVTSKRKIEIKRDQRLTEKENKGFNKEKEKEKLKSIESVEKLRAEHSTFFVKEINRISKEYELTWSDENIYDIDDQRDNPKRIQLLLFKKYSKKVSDLEEFIGEHCYYKKKKVWIENSDIKIKRYACEKILVILDKELLPTGRLNYEKSFKAISFLLLYYTTEKKIDELNMINDLIKKHQVLTLIYGDRMSGILQKFRAI